MSRQPREVRKVRTYPEFVVLLVAHDRAREGVKGNEISSLFGFGVFHHVGVDYLRSGLEKVDNLVIRKFKTDLEITLFL